MSLQMKICNDKEISKVGSSYTYLAVILTDFVHMKTNIHKCFLRNVNAWKKKKGWLDIFLMT